MKSRGKGMTRVLMLLLALLPILNIYMSPLPGFAIGDFLVLVCMIIYGARNSRQKLFHWETRYIVFWGYVAVSFLISSVASGYMYRALVPGGVSFFVFSLVFGFFTNKTDLQLLHRFLRIVAVVSIAVFVLQEASYILLGSRFSAILPYANLTDGVPTKELIYVQLLADRSSSFFREPAHFAQFLIVALAMDMFIEERGRKLSAFSIICIVALLFLRSGNGLLGLLILVAVKMLAIMKGRNSFYKYAIILLIPITMAIAMPYYMQTEAAQYVMGRTNELTFDKNARSYARIYRGYALYGALPVVNKLIGTDSEGILAASHNSELSGMFLGERNSDLYCNGVQQVLLNTGILGMVLLLVFIVPYYKKSGFLGKAALLSLLILSLVSSMFLSRIMLLMFLIAIEDSKRNSRDIVLFKEKSKSKIVNNESCILC